MFCPLRSYIVWYAVYIKTLLLGSDNLPRAVGTVIYSLQHKIYMCLLIIMHLTSLVRVK